MEIINAILNENEYSYDEIKSEYDIIERDYGAYIVDDSEMKILLLNALKVSRLNNL